MMFFLLLLFLLLPMLMSAKPSSSVKLNLLEPSHDISVLLKAESCWQTRVYSNTKKNPKQPYQEVVETSLEETM